ncbi:MAG: helix-turn-helix domain-containing protein [Alphaproteobacteria bacterium]|nr:helix-turn-helix domain-containing protein [Alphaproteobacteria bacterium]
MTGKKISVEASSGNVFADGGMPGAEEHLVKAQLVVRLDDILRSRRLTQAAAGKILGIAQPDLSKILRGGFRDVSVERLMRFLAALDQNVEIVVTPKTKGRKPATVTVRAA